MQQQTSNHAKTSFGFKKTRNICVFLLSKSSQWFSKGSKILDRPLSLHCTKILATKISTPTLRRKFSDFQWHGSAWRTRDSQICWVMCTRSCDLMLFPGDPIEPASWVGSLKIFLQSGFSLLPLCCSDYLFKCLQVENISGKKIEVQTCLE